MNQTKTVFLVLGIVLLFLLVGCTQTTPPETNSEKITVYFSYVDNTGATILEKSFEAEKSSNAFDVMKENIILEFEEYSFGALVTSVEGIAPPEGYYLALYVNGAYAEKGISDYTLEENTIIEWKMESLDSFG